MPPIPQIESPEPSMRELVEFHERYGLEAYLVWCVSFVDLPAWALMNMLRIGRHFGGLAQDQYERGALVELIRIPIPPEALKAILAHSAKGFYLSLAYVREHQQIEKAKA